MVLLELGCCQEALKAVTHWGVARILELGCCQEALKAVALTAQSPRPLLSSIMMFSWGSWRPSIFWRSSSKWRFHCASSDATFGFLADKGYILGWNLPKMGKYNTVSLKIITTDTSLISKCINILHVYCPTLSHHKSKLERKPVSQNTWLTCHLYGLFYKAVYQWLLATHKSLNILPQFTPWTTIMVNFSPAKLSEHLLFLCQNMHRSG